MFSMEAYIQIITIILFYYNVMHITLKLEKNAIIHCYINNAAWNLSSNMIIYFVIMWNLFLKRDNGD